MQYSHEICDVITGWFAAAVKGDTNWRDRHVSPLADLRIIGTDPEEWLKGKPAFEFLANEAKHVGGKISVVIQEVEGYREGNVGWGCAVPEITLQDGTIVSPRWSAVFHLENGTWRMVQLHASIAISNDEAFGDTFKQP
jgi:hypothetical protein